MEYEIEREKEYCVIPGCSNWTGNYKDTPIEERKHYIEDVGDPCEECATRLNEESKEAKREGMSLAYMED